MSIDITTLALAKEYTNRMVGSGGTGGGVNGKDGITPHIGDNGNWFIGTVDTGISAQGPAGENGVTPHIGTNGNWYIGSVNTGVSAKGARGDNGLDGNGIKYAILNSDYTLTLTFDDGTTYTTPSIRGATGSSGKDGSAGAAGKDGTDGVGIASIEQTATSTADGGSNVFTVTLTNGTTATFTVKNGSKGSTGKDGSNGVDGGHYTPVVTQPTTDTMQISFAPSKSDMPAVNPVTVNLPVSENSGQNVDLSGYAEKTWVQEGFQPKGTAESAVSAHNANNEAHPDIRLEIKAIREQLAAFLDVDEETLNELSELIARIVANQTSIAQLTTGKVNVADIIDNLTTNVANKPLSAAQGVVIKGLIDGLSSGKLDSSKLPEAINTALAQAKANGEFDGAKGNPGDPGRGIKSIARTSGNGAAGTVDIYTITYTDGTTGTYQVRNGANGKDGTAATFEITGATTLAYGATPTVTEASGSTAAARKYVVGIPAGKPGNDGTPVTVRSVVESTEDGGTNIVTLSDGTIINIKNGRKGADGYKLTPSDRTAIAEEVADMINSVEYEFMPQDITFPNPGYRGGDVGSKVAGSNTTTVGSWCQLQVKPGETYRVSAYRYYDAPAYVVGDASDVVVISGQKDGKEGDVIETFTIPENGAYLYVNNNQGKFVSLEKEEPVGVSIVALSKSPISYKTVVYDGDSICHGGSTNGGYARLVAEKVGGMYVNEGVGGGRLTTRNSGDTHHSVCDNIVNLPVTGDLYCFQGGVNDFWANSVPLGTYSKSDFTGAVDTTTVCGALEFIFRYALVNFLGKPICFIITHKCSGATYNRNDMGDTFEDYRNAMVGICNKYSIPYYDAFSESGLNGWNDAQRAAFTINSDGCHPTVDGYKHFYVPQLISLFERIMPIE